MRTLLEYGLANAVAATALALVALAIGLVVRRPAVRNALWVLVFIRLLLPPVPGFNFWVAAPLPTLAIGSWLWLRRYVSPSGAFVGAVLFVAAGPVASVGINRATTASSRSASAAVRFSSGSRAPSASVSAERAASASLA